MLGLFCRKCLSLRQNAANNCIIQSKQGTEGSVSLRTSLKALPTTIIVRANDYRNGWWAIKCGQ